MTRSAEEWEMSRSCQRGMFSRATWTLPRTRRARPGDPLAADGVLLVGHRGRALLALGERLLELEDLAPLEMPDLDGELLERRGDEGQRGDDFGVAVALQDLGRDRGGLEAELRRASHLDPGVEVDVGPDRARDPADADDLEGPVDPVEVALDLLVPDEELEPEGDRLGVDAVGPAHADRLLVLEGLAAEDLLQLQRGARG